MSQENKFVILVKAKKEKIWDLAFMSGNQERASWIASGIEEQQKLIGSPVTCILADSDDFFNGKITEILRKKPKNNEEKESPPENHQAPNP